MHAYNTSALTLLVYTACMHARTHTQTHHSHKTDTLKDKSCVWRQIRSASLSLTSYLPLWLSVSTANLSVHLYTNTNTHHHTYTLFELRRPWLCSHWQQWVCCSDVSGQHCMSHPVCVCVCSYRARLLPDQVCLLSIKHSQVSSLLCMCSTVRETQKTTAACAFLDTNRGTRWFQQQ